MEWWKFAYLPWKTITFLQSWIVVCGLLTENGWFRFLRWNGNSWTLTEFFVNFIFLLEVDEWDCFRKMGLWHIQQIEQRICWVSALVVTLFLETCDLLDPCIYRCWVSVFEVFGEHVQKQPSHIRKSETKYWAMHFKCRYRNCSLGCITHEEKSECMHGLLQWTFSKLLSLSLFTHKWNMHQEQVAWLSITQYVTHTSCADCGLHAVVVLWIYRAIQNEWFLRVLLYVVWCYRLYFFSILTRINHLK
jgi:hypothetical protein